MTLPRTTDVLIVGAGPTGLSLACQLVRCGLDFTVKAGDRMPYLILDGASIYDRLRQPKFHLIRFSKEGDSGKASTDEPQFPELIVFAYFQITSDVIEKFGADRPFNVFLRPDNYIAFISSELSSTEVKTYLNRFVRRSS